MWTLVRLGAVLFAGALTIAGAGLLAHALDRIRARRERTMMGEIDELFRDFPGEGEPDLTQTVDPPEALVAEPDIAWTATGLLQSQLKASRAAALEAEERIGELEKELHYEREATKRACGQWAKEFDRLKALGRQANRNADEWRSLCLGLHGVLYAIIEQLSVDLEVERAEADHGPQE